ncbi:carbonic anhydrase family protein [Pseudomonas putida]|uniref:carbonic anhydrase n=1 Tax=Pseudomonas putida TaxID=303 RepID=UPI00300EE1F3
MTLLKRCFPLLPSFLCILLSGVHADELHWTYQGNHGIAHWGEFSNGVCTRGDQQSPVDVNMKHVQPVKSSTLELKASYGAPALSVSNNGHTIQANVIDGETVLWKGDKYRLKQFHFHTPSEHLINHQSYPMELHMVHQDPTGRLLVLGILIKEGKTNKTLASLWDQLPILAGKTVTLTAPAAPNLDMLIPRTSHHLFYKGSLTTPPCTEGVQWILFEQPIELSKSQIQKFRQLFEDNHRPAQPINTREIEED